MAPWQQSSSSIQLPAMVQHTLRQPCCAGWSLVSACPLSAAGHNSPHLSHIMMGWQAIVEHSSSLQCRHTHAVTGMRQLPVAGMGPLWSFTGRMDFLQSSNHVPTWSSSQASNLTQLASHPYKPHRGLHLSDQGQLRPCLLQLHCSCVLGYLPSLTQPG